MEKKVRKFKKSTTSVKAPKVNKPATDKVVELRLKGGVGKLLNKFKGLKSKLNG